MGQENRDGFEIGGIHFTCMEDLEEYCFENPEIDECICICEYLKCIKEDTDTYYLSIWAEHID